MSLPPFPEVYFDISGICNAKCFWCDQGCRSRGAAKPIEMDRPLFTTPEMVEETLTSLLDNQAISLGTTIFPYNWGDPFLNPQLPDILRVIKKIGLSCSLSTNGSTLLRLEKNDDLSHVTRIRFSMPGFSQESYDRAHRFSFDMIRNRIKTIVKELRDHGMQGRVEIFFMIYNQNIEEIPAASHFSKELGADFRFNLAMFNNADVTEKYVRGILPEAILKKAWEDLFLVEPSEIIRSRPNNYVCPEFARSLSISHTGMLSLCCLCRLDPEFREYNIAPIKGMTREDIHRIRTLHPRCRTCSYYGVDHYYHEYYSYTANAITSILNQRLSTFLSS